MTDERRSAAIRRLNDGSVGARDALLALGVSPAEIAIPIAALRRTPPPEPPKPLCGDPFPDRSTWPGCLMVAGHGGDLHRANGRAWRRRLENVPDQG
jgi:hypothetical protein